MAKHKKIIIPVAIILGLSFWPLAIGILLAWLVYKFVGHKKLKYAGIVAILLPTFLINTVWSKTLFSPNSYKNSPKVNSVQTPTPSPSENIKGAQVFPTSTVTFTPTTLSTPTSTLFPKGTQVNIDYVVDGDTIKVLMNGNTETIRLIGIDTPEVVDPRKPVQCFGREASNKAKEILNNKTVYLESDPTQGERDKYQRLLRYVWLEDNTNFNKLMISEGYAHEYTYAVPYKYQTEFKQAEKEAETNNKGLWSPNTCNGITNSAVATPKPTTTIPKTTTTQPVQQSQQAQPVVTQEAPVNNTSGSYGCDCSKTCEQISSCAEAQYQLNTCGCKQRDADHDGIACDRAPLNCQQ